MNIETAITTDYVKLSPDTAVSKLVGTFDDPSVRGVVVAGDEFEGVITRRQVARSHQKPGEKLSSLAWHVPRVTPDGDIRQVARLMIDSDSRLLPVFWEDDGEMVGVVTDDTVLREVEPYLDAATVKDAYTPNIHAVNPETTFGKALHLMRENRITHLPVVDEAEPVGILSLYDLVDITIREMQQSQGGDAGGTDAHGADIADRAATTHGGGYGAREGELARILDLPVRDVMVSPVKTADTGETLQTAVDRMFEADISSLVVTTEGETAGIVTKTDLLESLTWEVEGTRAVQVYGSDLLGDTTYENVVDMIDKFDDRDGGMAVLDAKIHLQKHDERHRGTPLLLARIRLHTDRGLYMASGEGYGAQQALNDARDKLERRIRDRKTRGRSKKPPDEEFWEKRFGWMLEEA